MSFLARNDVSLPSKDAELLGFDGPIRLAIDASQSPPPPLLPSPSPAAAVPFSVPPPPLSANAATSPARERQEPSVGPNPQVWTRMQAGSTPFSIFPSDQRTPEATGISDGRATESAAAAEESLLQQPEAAAAQEWVVAATPELSGWEAPSGAESIDVDATSSVRKRQEPALANAVAFQQLESPGAGVVDDSGVDAGSAHVRPRPPPQPPPPPQYVRIAARL